MACKSPATSLSGCRFKRLPGRLLLFPGDVSRHVTMNTLPADTIYIAFDVTVSADATTDDAGSADAAVADVAANFSFEMLSSTSGAVLSTPPLSSSASLPPSPSPLSLSDQRAVYSLRRRRSDQQSAPRLANVEDVSRWGTPVGVLRLPEAASDALNALVAADAARLDQRYGRRGSFAVFQSPNKFNLFEHADENGDPYPSVSTLRGLVRDAMLTYLGNTCDCALTSGPSTAQSSCDKQHGRWQKWFAGGGKQLSVTSSWVNIAGKKQRSINQLAHNHLVYGTSVTGVYYAASGWSDAAAKQAGERGGVNSTNLWLIRPTHLSSRLTATSMAVQPTPGTMLIFPTFLQHLADVHGGDEDRISVAFNAE